MKKHVLQFLHSIFAKKSDQSFYSKLLLSFLIVSVTSTLLLTVFLTVNFSNTLYSSTNNYNQQLLVQTNYAVDQLYENVERLTSTLLADGRITAFLSAGETDSMISILASQEVIKQLMVLPYVDSICLYNAKLDLLYSSKNGYLQSPDHFEEQEIASRLKNPVFIANYQKFPVPSKRNSKNGSAKLLSYYFFDNYNTSKDNGRNAIIINVNSSILTDSITAMKNFSSKTESNFILLDKNRVYLTGVLNSEFTSEAGWIHSALKAISSKDALSSSYIIIDGETYFQTHTEDNVYGWHLLNYIPVHVIFQDVVTSTLISTLLLVVVFIFTWFICRRLARQLNAPLEALTSFVSGNKDKKKEIEFLEAKEFQTILQNVSSLQENNQQLHYLQQQTRYSLTQSCLNELVMNRQVDSPALIHKKLKHLNLTYLETEKLCMAVFKIDNYQNFIKKYTQDELWAIRFSVVNIVEELTSGLFTCNAFSCDNDKFVSLIAYEQDGDFVALEDQMVLLFQSIQENISKYLHFTVSVAYSPVFQGIEKLHSTYKNAETSLLLKMRFGHNTIIDPYMIDDVSVESFQLSYKLTNQLIDQLANGQLESSMDTYAKLTQNLFSCDHAEILATMIHLFHSIYERLSEKYPMLKDSITTEFKTFLSGLELAEISDDVHTLSQNFFTSICSSVQELKSNPAHQSSSITAEKITQIINEQYSNSSLCLSSIAEEVGLSSNYAGHIFKQCTQKSISQYLLDIRMQKVAEYLQTTSLPLSTILERVGLEKNNYFYTRFKNYFGMSLGEYKQKFHVSSGE